MRGSFFDSALCLAPGIIGLIALLAGVVQIFPNSLTVAFQAGVLGFRSSEFGGAGSQVLRGVFTVLVGATGGDGLLAFGNVGLVLGDAWGEFGQLGLHGSQAGGAETRLFRRGMATAASFAQVAAFCDPVLSAWQPGAGMGSVDALCAVE